MYIYIYSSEYTTCIVSLYRNVVCTTCVAVCCNVLQCVAVCCRVLQCVAVCCSSSEYATGVVRFR